MATIRDMPDRLNSEPVVFRGFTTPELGLAACIGVVLGLIISLPFSLFLSWLVIPTGSLLFPLVFISFGGKWLARKKRGKPENYIWQMFALRKRQMGIGDPKLIVDSRRWSVRRSIPIRSTK